MNSNTQATQTTGDDLNHLTRHAKTLISATADMAEAKIDKACNQLTGMLDHGKEMYVSACQQAFKGTHAADVAVHKHVYQTIAISVGVGALIGYLCATRHACNCD